MAQAAPELNNATMAPGTMKDFGLEPIYRRDHGDIFAKVRAMPEFTERFSDPVYGILTDRYFPHTRGEAPIDESFVLPHNGRPALICEAYTNGVALDHFGFPISMTLSQNISPSESRPLLREAANRLHEAATENRYQDMRYLDSRSDENIGPDGAAWLSLGAAPEIQIQAAIDLSLSENAIHSALRKSYKSLVNWGKRELEIAVVDRANPDAAKFEQYRLFHAKVAGRTTRPDASWDAMLELICNGHGELLLGYWNAALVSATLVMDGAARTVYVSAVYDRENFDKPLGHWPLYHAILRARARGLSWFDLGEVPVKTSAIDQKAYTIGQFKKGFATDLQAQRIWHWQGDPATSAEEQGTVS